VRRGSRGVIAAAAAAGAVAAVAAIPAEATRRVFIDSRIGVARAAPAFHGYVHSRHHDFCAPERKVKVFRERPGKDELLGTDKTNEKGFWRVIVDPLASGAYYAKVTRLATGAAGTIYVCRADRSRVLVVD